MTENQTKTGERTAVRDSSVQLVTDVEESLLSMQAVVGRKWHPVILYYLLSDGPLGFSALKDRVDGISSKMLSEGLDDLESAGIVSRTLLNDQPVRVEYGLTDRGQSLEPLITEMARWGDQHDFPTDTNESTDDRSTGTVQLTALYAEGE